MARKWMLGLVGLMLTFALVGCGPSEKSWQEAETSANKFLTDFTNQKFVDNFQMWDKLSFWKLQAVSEEAYVANMKQAVATLPEMFNWAYTLERFDADDKNGIYKFKAKLRFRAGDPVEVANRLGQPKPNISEEMLLIMQRRPEGWRVLTMQLFEVIDTFSRSSPSPTKPAEASVPAKPTEGGKKPNEAAAEKPATE